MEADLAEKSAAAKAQIKEQYNEKASQISVDTKALMEALLNKK